MKSTHAERAALVLVLLSFGSMMLALMLPWYHSTSGSTLQYYIEGDMGELSQRILFMMFIWGMLFGAYAISFLRQTKARGVVFGWLAISICLIAVAYFIAAVDEQTGTPGFWGSGVTTGGEISYGPSLGWFFACAVVAISCASVFVGYSTAKSEHDSDPGPFHE